MLVPCSLLLAGWCRSLAEGAVGAAPVDDCDAVVAIIEDGAVVAAPAGRGAAAEL